MWLLSTPPQAEWLTVAYRSSALEAVLSLGRSVLGVVNRSRECDASQAELRAEFVGLLSKLARVGLLELGQVLHLPANRG